MQAKQFIFSTLLFSLTLSLSLTVNAQGTSAAEQPTEELVEGTPAMEEAASHDRIVPPPEVFADMPYVYPLVRMRPPPMPRP